MNHPLSIDGDTHEDLMRLYLNDVEEGDADAEKRKEDKEWCYFLKFVDDFPHLKPYRTEWLVYNEDWKLSGSIDMVYENEDGTLSIYDWKRSKEIIRVNNFNEYSCTDSICHLPNTNFWHYSLQLNTYKSILEAKYDKKIKDLYLVRLHPNNEDETYELIDVPILHTPLTRNIKLIPGTMNIHRWVRPVDFTFEIADLDQPLHFKKGDPLFAVRFKTQQKVTLKQLEYSNDLKHITEACLTSKNFVPRKSLKYRYKMAERWLKGRRWL
jgi:hypothetical protein